MIKLSEQKKSKIWTCFIQKEESIFKIVGTILLNYFEEKKFKDQYNILTFDLRGHGNSWKPKNLEDYEIKKFAEDFFELVSFLKIKKFILIMQQQPLLIRLY